MDRIPEHRMKVSWQAHVQSLGGLVLKPPLSAHVEPILLACEVIIHGVDGRGCRQEVRQKHAFAFNCWDGWIACCGRPFVSVPFEGKGRAA
jgi:hypothetical protein